MSPRRARGARGAAPPPPPPTAAPPRVAPAPATPNAEPSSAPIAARRLSPGARTSPIAASPVTSSIAARHERDQPSSANAPVGSSVGGPGGMASARNASAIAPTPRSSVSAAPA